MEKKAKTKRRGLQFVVGIPLLILLAFVLVKSFSKDTPTSTTKAGFTFGTGACANADGSSPGTDSFTAAPSLCIDPAKSYTASVHTNVGDFTITLDPAHAIGNVNNFVTLARYHYYDNHDCHRIIAGFVVQCGRPGDASKESAPGYTVGDEKPTRAYRLGDIAMANTGKPNTGGGQFFIIDGPQGEALPQTYSLIGTVKSGYDTTIQAMASAAAPDGSPPIKEIKLISVTINEGPAVDGATATTVVSTNPPVAAETGTTVAGTATTTPAPATTATKSTTPAPAPLTTKSTTPGT